VYTLTSLKITYYSSKYSKMAQKVQNRGQW
jgi:hypothetical protein